MNTINMSPINQSENGLICTNLANDLGHHPVYLMDHSIVIVQGGALPVTSWFIIPITIDIIPINPSYSTYKPTSLTTWGTTL